MKCSRRHTFHLMEHGIVRLVNRVSSVNITCNESARLLVSCIAFSRASVGGQGTASIFMPLAGLNKHLKQLEESDGSSLRSDDFKVTRES